MMRSKKCNPSSSRPIKHFSHLRVRYIILSAMNAIHRRTHTAAVSNIEHREQSKHSNILNEMTGKENTIANGFNLDSYFGFIVSSVSVVCADGARCRRVKWYGGSTRIVIKSTVFRWREPSKRNAIAVKTHNTNGINQIFGEASEKKELFFFHFRFYLDFRLYIQKASMIAQSAHTYT